MPETEIAPSFKAVDDMLFLSLPLFCFSFLEEKLEKSREGE